MAPSQRKPRLNELTASQDSQGKKATADSVFIVMVSSGSARDAIAWPGTGLVRTTDQQGYRHFSTRLKAEAASMLCKKRSADQGPSCWRQKVDKRTWVCH